MSTLFKCVGGLISTEDSWMFLSTESFRGSPQENFEFLEHKGVGSISHNFISFLGLFFTFLFLFNQFSLFFSVIL